MNQHRRRRPQQGGRPHRQGAPRVGRLAAEWRATEAAVAERDAEIPYPMTRVVADIERVAEKLAQDPAWG